MDEIEVFRASLDEMDDTVLQAEACRLRAVMVKHDAAYVAIRERFAAGEVEKDASGTYHLVAPGEDLLRESQRDRTCLRLVEHHITRRSSIASLASYGSCPADWPEDEASVDADTGDESCPHNRHAILCGLCTPVPGGNGE